MSDMYRVSLARGVPDFERYRFRSQKSVSSQFGAGAFYIGICLCYLDVWILYVEANSYKYQYISTIYRLQFLMSKQRSLQDTFFDSRTCEQITRTGSFHRAQLHDLMICLITLF